MKTLSYGTRGVAALVAAWFGYINQNFTPLFWVLLALIAVDLILNVHHEEKQLSKIGSAFMSAGFPYVITQTTHVELAIRAAVVLGTIVYIQIVFPQLIQAVGKINFGSGPKAKFTQAEVEALLAQAQAAAQKEAQAIAQKNNIPVPPQNQGGASS